MLWRDDRLDDVGDIIYVGECFDAEEDVVEGLLGGMCGIFRCADNCTVLMRVGSGKVWWGHTSIGLKPLVTVKCRSG